VTFTVDICLTCGEAAFPRRALCPICGGNTWTTRDATHGIIEQVTVVQGVGIASVRLHAGPVVIARVPPETAVGAELSLSRDGGVPVGTNRHA